MGAKNFLSGRAKGLFKSAERAPDPRAAENALAQDNPDLAWDEYGAPRQRARRQALDQDEAFARIEVSDAERAEARAALDRLRR